MRENDTDASSGFDYQFNAIHDESNELFAAYKEMFEIAVSQQGGGLWELAIVYAPILDRFAVSVHKYFLYLALTRRLQPGPRYGVVKRCQEVIRRVAGRLIQEKKRKIEEAEKAGSVYGGRDLLSALCACSSYSLADLREH